MLKDRAVIAAFLLSASAHYLILSAAGTNLIKVNPEKVQERGVMLEIEVPPLVPDIDVMEDKKMIKEREKIEPGGPAEKTEPAPEFPADENAENALQEYTAGEDKKERVEAEEPSPEEMLRYRDMVKRRIEEARRYPPWAKKHSIEGVVHIGFYIMPEGSADDVKIIRRSGSGILDREAVATVRRAAPYPHFPDGCPGDYLQMEVKIVFKHN